MLRSALIPSAAAGSRAPTLRDVAPPSRVRVGPSSLAYDVTGASRVPLVLVHGHRGSRLDFLDVRSALSRRRRLLILDRRGHGESSRGGPYGIARAMRDLEDFLEALGEPVVDLLGHDAGGMVALRLALSRPTRVRSLALVGTSPGPLDRAVVGSAPTQANLPARVRAFTAAALGRDDASRLAATLEAPPPVRRRFLDIARYGHAHADPAAVRDIGEDLVSLRSVEGELGRYDRPALVLVGERDTEFAEPSAALARGLPRARLVTVAGAGHFPHFEARDAFLTAVEAHLAAASGERS